MNVLLSVRNDSARKRLYRRDTLTQLAEKICKGEGMNGKAELSLLFCDDPFIRELNKQYRDTNKATDVLSFEQEAMPGAKVRLLGDIVISLETVARYCRDNRQEMRQEVHLLFCHGVLHLLGYDHATKKERQTMQTRQSKYLDVDLDAAWRERDKQTLVPKRARGGGDRRLGRR